MRPRILTLVGHDARLQFRYGIYAAYSVVVLTYVTVILASGPHLPGWVVATIIFTDPAALGFFFLGALMMLERSEGVRTALTVSPIGAADYLGSKVITLTAMALVACVALLIAAQGGGRPVLLLTAVTLTSIQYVGIGVPIAMRFRTVSGYLIGSAGLLTPVIAPGFLALLDPFPLWLAAIPAVSQYRLILVATDTGSATTGEIVLMLVVCAVAAAGACWLALQTLKKEFGK
jgi:fluoroquinolone transport system permease protein